MKKRIFIGIGAFVLIFSAWLYVVTPDERDKRAEVNRRVFDSIKEKSHWDMRKPMLYGFFFTCTRETPLKILGFLLSIGDHRVVDISKDDDKDFYWLHVERIQVHDLNSVSTKDVRLRRIGAMCISEYDGWDVGPDLTPTKKNEK